MYEIKKFLQSHCLLCLIILFVIFGIFVYLYGKGQVLSSDGNGAQPIRNELESAADDSSSIKERIGEAERTVDGIEKSAERSRELAREAAGILTECQQLIETIRSRAKENTGKDSL